MDPERTFFSLFSLSFFSLSTLKEKKKKEKKEKKKFSQDPSLSHLVIFDASLARRTWISCKMSVLLSFLLVCCFFIKKNNERSTVYYKHLRERITNEQ